MAKPMIFHDSGGYKFKIPGSHVTRSEPDKIPTVWLPKHLCHDEWARVQELRRVQVKNVPEVKVQVVNGVAVSTTL